MKYQCSFIVPCYKEKSEVIITTVQELTNVARSVADLEYEIIVVNDGMNRDTFPSFTENAIQVIHHARNQGYGASLMAGR